MPLTIHQKSVYLIIFNATMISRSVGNRLKKSRKTLKDFKVRVFQELDRLTGLMDDGQLIENDITQSIEKLRTEFQISFGQAQKAINVILKYHFYLTRGEEDTVKRALHCPVDSVILKELDRRGISLAGMDRTTYAEIQRDIEERSPSRIEFDTRWDTQHLRDEGII